MTRLVLIAGLLVTLAGAPPAAKRRHQAEEGKLPPTKSGQTTTSPTKEEKTLPGFSEIRATENGKGVGQLTGSPSRPHFLTGSDRLGLAKPCDHKIPLEQLFAFPHPTDLQNAAEGPAYLAEGKLSQITAEGKTPVTVFSGTTSLFRVSPDGHAIAGASEGTTKSTLHFRQSGPARTPVEIPGVVLSMEWKPPAGDLLLSVGSADGFQLYRLAPGAAQPSPGQKLDGLAYVTDVSPDGNQAAYTIERSDVRSEIWLWDLTTNQTKRWLKSKGLARAGKFSGDSKGLFFIDDGKTGHAKLYYAAMKDPETTRLIAGGKPEVQSFTLSPSRNTLAVETSEDGYSRLTGVTLDPAGRIRGQWVAPKLSPGVIESLAFTDDSRLFFVRSSTQEPHEIWAADQGQTAKWSRFYGGTVPPDCWAGELAVTYPTFDGKAVPAFLYPSSTPLTSAGAVFLQGEPEETYRPGFHPLVRYLIERGVTVIAPNPRGRAGYGRDWRLLGEGSHRAQAARDLAWAGKWLEKEKRADANRIGAVGSGYSGWVAHAADELVPGQFASVTLTDPWQAPGNGFIGGRPFEERKQQSTQLREGVAAIVAAGDSASLTPKMIFGPAQTGARLPASEQAAADLTTASGRTAHARAVVSFLESKKRKGP